MTTFNWVVTTLYTQTIDGEQNYVVNANYEVTGTDGEYSSTFSGSSRFSTEKVTSFTPYEQLTNDIVIGWIKQDLRESGIISIQACIEGQIDSQKNPPIIPQNTPLPWSRI